MGKAKKIVIETLRIACIAIAVLFVACFVGFVVLINFIPHENKLAYAQAITIAKSCYGCESILWVGNIYGNAYGSGFVVLPNGERINYNRGAFYVIGEKEGRETCIVMPFNIQKEISIATWALDYSFKDIVEKFNERGAQYTAEKTLDNDYYGVKRNSIEVIVGEESITTAANYADMADTQTFYERLDVKAVFSYDWTADGYRHYCIVSQEGGELKSYESVTAVSE